MKKFSILFLLFIVALTLTHCKPSAKLSGIKTWVCYYESELPANLQYSYNLYILDGDHHPALEPLKINGAKTVGYISFGEVNVREKHYEESKAAGFLVDENKNWPGSYRTDFTNKKWHDIVINKLIPKILDQGFDGIFIDTIDTADYLENVKKIKGNVKGAIALLKKVREKYPKMIMVLNNGLFMLDYVGEEIDALLVEDIYTLYDFEKKTYNLTSPKQTLERLVPIKAFQRKFKKPVLALDYLDKKDKKDIARIAKMARDEDLLPYISNIHLTEIFFH